MSDKPEPTAEEKMADALPANAKYVAAHPNSRRGLLVKPHIRFPSNSSVGRRTT